MTQFLILMHVACPVIVDQPRVPAAAVWATVQRPHGSVCGSGAARHCRRDAETIRPPWVQLLYAVVVQCYSLAQRLHYTMLHSPLS